ncbi:UNKNOWN [Stylonychia lemnae]|uniref:Uncharacterized protein n=1 Tax=Stylonychia lemnae TaxID=5949 RepID=A0A078AH26_STYLE|nr:UNKNOWN [Stylonychia lemnae]|eukprot:CDW81131.1 UNKNOWN [Stylonychia lemnae]
MSQNSQQIIPKKLFKVCCCCIPIQAAVNIIGVLDVIALIGAMMVVILSLIGNSPRGQSYYTGTYLFTIIPSFLLIRLPRAVFYFRMRINMIGTISIRFSGNKNSTQNSKDDNDDKENSGYIAFQIIIGVAQIFAYCVIDMYFTLLVRQYRDNLILDQTRVHTDRSSQAQRQRQGSQQGQDVESQCPVVSGIPVQQSPINYDSMYGFQIVGVGEQGPELASQKSDQTKSNRRSAKSLEKLSYYPGLPVYDYVSPTNNNESQIVRRQSTLISQRLNYSSQVSNIA